MRIRRRGQGVQVGETHVPHHGVRMVAIWVAANAVAIPLVVLVLGHHLPPGRMTLEAGAQRDANTLLTALLTPIVLLILVFFIYAIVSFRQRGEGISDGPPLKGYGPTQLIWIVATTIIVLALAIWGSYTLIGSAHGAGGGQGPDPISFPKGWHHGLQVQVIGQQWDWTFRYPQYGAVETTELVIPRGRVVELHVTSLDVTHSFWAYQLGVKADAVPGVDNIVFVDPRHDGRFQIRCAELCGLWHGHMAKFGRVVERADFATFISGKQQEGTPIAKYLPPYSRTYFPDPLRRAG
jgi:cytochrome c oxidase subunit 2